MAAKDDASLGSAVITLVATVYLAALAIGIVVFRAKPFVGGLAAVIAIVAGRGIQIWLDPGRRRGDENENEP